METLDAVLDPNDPVHRALRDQIPHLGVRERCSCGCGTTYFEIDPDAVTPAPTGPGTVVAATAQVVTEAGGNPGEILVFAENGYLSWLEVCSWTDERELTLADASRWLQIEH
jgi:hypothetical protein